MRLGLSKSWLWLGLFACTPCLAIGGSGLSTVIDQLEFEDTALVDVVSFLNQKSQALSKDGNAINFVIDPSVDLDRTISLRLRQVTLGGAMACLVDYAGLDYRVEPHACLILAPGKGQLANRVPHPNEVAAQFAPAVAARNGKLDQVEFTDAPIRDVLVYLSQKSTELDSPSGGLNLVLSSLIDPDMPVTLSLRNVPISSVLYYLTKVAALEIRIEPYAIFIDPPGTRALRLAKQEMARRAAMERWAEAAANQEPRPRGMGYSLGGIPNDPRSPVHPDYVSSGAEDIRTRTNALNNVYKWVNGKWTFVRYGSGDPNKPSLDENGRRLITPSLQPAKR